MIGGLMPIGIMLGLICLGMAGVVYSINNKRLNRNKNDN